MCIVYAYTHIIHMLYIYTSLSLSLCVYIYIYIHIMYAYIHHTYQHITFFARNITRPVFVAGESLEAG